MNGLSNGSATWLMLSIFQVSKRPHLLPPHIASLCPFCLTALSLAELEKPRPILVAKTQLHFKAPSP